MGSLLLTRTNPDGLSSEEAAARIEKFGHNRLEHKEVNPILQFLGFMWNPLSWVMESLPSLLSRSRTAEVTTRLGRLYRYHPAAYSPIPSLVFWKNARLGTRSRPYGLSRTRMQGQT